MDALQQQQQAGRQAVGKTAGIWVTTFAVCSGMAPVSLLVAAQVSRWPQLGCDGIWR